MLNSFLRAWHGEGPTPRPSDCRSDLLPLGCRDPVAREPIAVVVFSKWEYKVNSLFVDIAPLFNSTFST